MANIIKASTLMGKKEPTEALLRSLIVTGGSMQIKSWLTTVKYDGDSPVAVPVLVLDQETPRIKGAKWQFTG